MSSAQRNIKCQQKQWSGIYSLPICLNNSSKADFADKVLTKLVDFASWLKVLSNKSTLHETVCWIKQILKMFSARISPFYFFSLHFSALCACICLASPPRPTSDYFRIPCLIIAQRPRVRSFVSISNLQKIVRRRCENMLQKIDAKLLSTFDTVCNSPTENR